MMQGMIRSVKFCFLILILCFAVKYSFATEDIPELQSIIREVDSLNTLASKYYNEETDRSQALAIQSLNLARTCHYKAGEAMALDILGVANLNEDNYPIALQYYFKVLTSTSP